MRATVNSVDVVRKGKECLGPRVTLILEGDLHGGCALHSFNVDRTIVCDFALAIQMANKRDDATLEVEGCFAIGAIIN